MIYAADTASRSVSNANTTRRERPVIEKPYWQHLYGQMHWTPAAAEHIRHRTATASPEPTHLKLVTYVKTPSAAYT